MSNDTQDGTGDRQLAKANGGSLLRGSLRDALAAASGPTRSFRAAPPQSAPALTSGDRSSAGPAPPKAEPMPVPKADPMPKAEPGPKSEPVPIELDAPRTRVVRSPGQPAPAIEEGAVQTQRLRGRMSVKRTEFHQDPVVGWLVVVGGPGLGAFRPIFEGNNTLGRGKSQRIPIDFGDEAISSEEQAYIRYDSVDRKFLLVPNMAKTNIVAVNDKKPTAAVTLAAMDLISMGRTQLCFVPFCGGEFDWAELSEMKG